MIVEKRKVVKKLKQKKLKQKKLKEKKLKEKKLKEKKLILKIYDPKEMVSKKKGERKQRYSEYIEAISPYIDMFKEEINKSEDNMIRVDLLDIKKLIKMENKSRVSIYWSLKYVMFDYGIVLIPGKTEKGNDVLIMRLIRNDDKLPKSLEKIKMIEKRRGIKKKRID